MDTSRGEPREMSFLEFLAGYLVTLGAMVGGGLFLESYFGWSPLRGLFLAGAILYLLAAALYPGWLFQVVRRVRWFGSIESDELIRALLIILGFAMLGVFALWHPLERLFPE
jgi:hypothetical protein